MPKDAQGKTFFEESSSYQRLARSFQHLLDEPGLGLLTGEPGVGKTAALRNLCWALPKPDYLVVYIADTTISPLELYRLLAIELGVRPSHRRGQLWSDIKKALVHMVDERSTAPVLIVDESQHLSDKFLLDLAGFLNFAFDSRDLLTLWLAGSPRLAQTLSQQEHAALAMRVSASVHFEPFTDREIFVDAVRGSLSAVGARDKIIAEPALDLLFRQSRGLFRVAGKLLRSALRFAHERDQSFVDEATMALAVDQLFSAPPKLQKT
jgi:type II secretory pathway predicted ATPase ExeA